MPEVLLGLSIVLLALSLGTFIVSIVVAKVILPNQQHQIAPLVVPSQPPTLEAPPVQRDENGRLKLTQEHYEAIAKAQPIKAADGSIWDRIDG